MPTRRTTLLLALTLLATVTLAACGGGTATDGAGDGGSTPAWIVSVEPAPGATVAVPDLVRVTFQPTGPDQAVRLVLDGTDVTSYAVLDGDALVYDPNTGPVRLEGGEHTATARLTERPTNDATEYGVVDEYDWSFRTG